MTKLRESRRTSRITLDGIEELMLCEPECRNEFLGDLGVPGGSNQFVYRATGRGEAFVRWSGFMVQVAWKRVRPNTKDCDLCGDEWSGRSESAAMRSARRPRTPAQEAASLRLIGRDSTQGQDLTA